MTDSRTVLIVDDDEMTAMMLSHALGTSGVRVSSAGTWTGARRQLETLRPALIMLDLMLPDADGRAALAELRETPATANTPVFIVSGGVGAAARSECLILGAARYVEKPMHLPDVTRWVTDTIRLSRADADWRVDAGTGLLNRAGFKDALARANLNGTRYVAAIGVSNGSDTLPTEVVSSLRERTRAATPPVALALWSTAVVGLLFDGDEGGAVQRVGMLLDTGRGGTPLTAGVVQLQSGDSLDAVMARALHRLSLAHAGAAVVAGDEPRNHRVLLVEDDPIVATLVVARLRRAGMDVVHCANGGDALREADAGSFSCALLAVNLPDADGFSILTALRARPGARPPVAMLTSMGREEDVARGFELGADDYIIKPFSPNDLAARVQRLVDRRTGDGLLP